MSHVEEEKEKEAGNLFYRGEKEDRGRGCSNPKALLETEFFL